MKFIPMDRDMYTREESEITTLLLLEDNIGDQLLITSALAECNCNYSVTALASLQSGIDYLCNHAVDLVLLNLDLPDALGASSLQTLLQHHSDTAVVVLTELDCEELTLATVRSGAQDYLVKGCFDADSLCRCIRYALARKQAEQRLHAVENQLECLSRSARDAILVIDPQSTIIWANKAAELIFNVQHNTLVGTPVTHYVDQVAGSDLLARLQQSPASLDTQRIVVDAQIVGQEHRVINYSLSHWPNDKGQIRYSLIARDVTLQRDNEAQIKTALEVQTVISCIRNLKGQKTPLKGKLSRALGALINLSWIKQHQRAAAAIYIEQPNHPPLLAGTGIDIPVAHYQQALQQLETQSPLSSNLQGCFDQEQQPRWFGKIKLSEPAARALIVLVFNNQPEHLGRVETQLAEIIEAIAALIDEHLQHARIAQLSRAVEQSPTGTLMTDANGTIIYANQALLNMTGYQQEEVVGQNPRLFKSGETPLETYQHLWKTITNGQIWHGEIRNRRKDGREYWESQTIAPVLDEMGDPVNFIAIKENIDLRKRAESQLLQMATHDALTNLPNRVLLLDRLTQALGNARRYGHGVSVMLLDLDQFKMVNDQQGHQIGDQILRLVGARLAEQLRETDTIGRQGGDEFILILPDTAQPHQLQPLLERYLKTLSAPFCLENYTATLSCSIGVALSHRGEIEATELYRQADVAMYKAKAQGGNRYCFYEPELDIVLNQRIWFQTAIKTALAENQFLLYYQPQICNKTGQLTGAEALIRWQHPEKGLIPPDQFISLAESSGDIVAIGDWVLEEGCRQLSSWNHDGFILPSLAVNLSALQLYDPELPQRIAARLARHGIQPQQLEVELTESQIMQSPEVAVTSLKQLRDLGVYIAGDDFGTGYSSLSYLKRLPLHKLKIDRSFITDISTDHDSHAIASMIIGLGKSLNLKVLAEGIEKPEQLSLLTRLGCDEFQGYLCSPPLPAEQFIKLCHNKDALIDIPHTQEDDRVLLLVDDEISVLKSLYRILRRNSYRILMAENAIEAYRLLASTEVGVIICDQRMPQITGTEFLSEVKGMYPNTVRMVLSGYADLETIISAINDGAIFKFLAKPWEEDLLKGHINEAFQVYEMRKREQSLASPEQPSNSHPD